MEIDTFNNNIFVTLSDKDVDKQVISHTYRLGVPSGVVLGKKVANLISKELASSVGEEVTRTVGEEVKAEDILRSMLPNVHVRVSTTCHGMQMKIYYKEGSIDLSEDDLLDGDYFCKNRWPFAIECIFGVEYFKSERQFRHYQTVYNSRGPRKLLRLRDLKKR